MSTPVTNFYKGQRIFITGASGLMGKVLIEKLLYSCTDVDKIYILVRPKRGKSIEERVQDMWKLPLFWRIREQRPDSMKKVIPLQGDVLYEELGLEKSTLKMLYDEVTMVFHFAATLRLEAPLKDGVDMNLCGTRRLLDVVGGMKNLIAFIHLSTAFCYPDYEKLPEQVPDPPNNPHDVMRVVEWMDPKALELITPQLLKDHPNSYTYSKRLAEALVKESYPRLPIAIARPSIVTPSFKEPVPGWVDNLNGPIGLMVGAGKGVIRSMHCIGEYHAEVIPLDYAINAVITIGYRTGIEKQRPAEIPVYNITTGDERDTTWKDVLDMGKDTVRKYPFESPLWYPDGNIRSNKLYHKLCVFLYHWIPAYFIDFLMFIFWQKRFMVRIQNRISVGLEVLQYFTTREWYFETRNFKDLFAKLTPEDRDIFTMDFSVIDDKEYIESCMLGGRQYCLKEPLSSLPKARLQNRILYVLDKIVQVLFYYYLFSLIASHLDEVRYAIDYLFGTVKGMPIVSSIIFQEKSAVRVS